MRLTLLVLSALLLTACPTVSGDDDDAANSDCDGIQDTGEFYPDESYDADGDRFFDAEDPGCAEFYGADELDCDDTDPLVNPDRDETECNDIDDDCDPDTADSIDLDLDTFTNCDGDCDDESALIYPGAPDEDCNGIDEDCNGEDGEPCDIDYDGEWTLTSAVTYSCDGWTIDFSSLTINHEDPLIAVVPAGSDQPTNLQGDFTSETQFLATQSVSGGGCDAEFSMLGTFTSENSFFGTLSVNFAGAQCGADGCAGQSLGYEATR